MRLVLTEWKERAEKNNLPFAKYINTDKRSFYGTNKLCEKIGNDAEKEATDWIHYLAKDKDMRDILKRMIKAQMAYAKYHKVISNSNK
jgi:thiamine monophosphate synthase